MPLWREHLTKSLQHTRHQPESRYIQLATVDRAGMPANRTVVFRGIEDNGALMVVSDTRTDKWQDLQHCNDGAVCWYFSKTREQYRFAVNAQCLTLASFPAVVEEYWSRLSEAGKKQFFWGEPKTPRDASQPLPMRSDTQDVPPHFGVIRLQVMTVDYLSLRGNPQYREWHYKDDRDEWVSKAVIP